MARFWESPDGLAVRDYLEKNVIKTGQTSWSGRDLVWMGSASLDELLIEVSRFFILKAVNGDTEAPKLAGQPPHKRAKTSASGTSSNAGRGAQFSPSYEVDQVWHALLLFPQVYHQICMRLASKIICHDPRSGDGNRAERYSLTIKEYITQCHPKRFQMLLEEADLAQDCAAPLPSPLYLLQAAHFKVAYRQVATRAC
eukprot:Skav231436  [mRNA]  locus=scaffold330:253158:255193:+ [translate_table: standard]